MNKEKFKNKLRYTDIERYLIEWWPSRDVDLCHFDTVEQMLAAVPNCATVEDLKEQLNDHVRR